MLEGLPPTSDKRLPKVRVLSCTSIFHPVFLSIAAPFLQDYDRCQHPIRRRLGSGNLSQQLDACSAVISLVTLHINF
jgi:hypothetical protein